MISLSVLVWTILTVNLCVLVLHFLIRKTRLLLHCGLGFFLISCLLCAMRLFLPVEFSYFQHKMEYPDFISSFMRIFISDDSLSTLAYGLGIFCLVVGLLLIVISFFKRIRIQKKLYEYSRPDDHSAQILTAIDPNCDIPTRKSLLNTSPVIVGCRKPVIYLPEASYSDTDLKGILIHEYTHWRNHHLWIKSIVHIFVLLFWWNPFIFLLEKDFSHLLEMQCDNLSTKQMGDDEKLEYLQTLLHCLDAANHIYADNYNLYGLGFSRILSHQKTRQRFEYQINRTSEKHAKHWQVLGVYGLMFCWVFASYYYIAQPAYSPKQESAYSNSNNSFLLENEDGSYSFHFNDQVIPVDEEDVHSGYYSIYTIISHE